MIEPLLAPRDRHRPDEVPAGRGPVVAYVGPDVPRELIRAAGAVPYRLVGRPGFTAPADTYCGPELDAVARSQLARVLAGELAGRAGLVIGGDCEGSRRAFWYLREIQRLEPYPGVPPFTFLDLLHRPQRGSLVYSAIRLRQLATRLAAWTGTGVTDARLRAEIAAANRERALLASVHSLRSTVDGPRLSGVDAFHARDTGHETLRLLLAADLPVLPGRRVFLTGSAHDRPTAYEALESRGMVVVGEDTGHQSVVSEDPHTDPYAALAQAYCRGVPAQSAGYRIADRAAYTARLARESGAELAIGWLRAGDGAPAWDVAATAAALGELRIPLRLLPATPYGEVPHAELDRVAAVSAP